MHCKTILAAAIVVAVLLPQEARAFSRAPFFASPLLQQNQNYPISSSQLNLYVETDKYSTSTRPNSAPTPTVKTLEEYVKDRGGDRVIKKVLIANNGMAATKSIISMRRWAYMELGNENAIHFVAMATPEDIRSNAEFVRLADSFVEVPGGKNLNNYANVTVISQVAKEQGVDAVWPGWGHASENPKLPATLTELGIKFIGPTSPVMSVLGDKIAANILAQTAGLPSVPWSGSFGGENDGPLQAELTEEGTIPTDTFEKGTCRTVEQALEVARRIGYENGIMIKASEGGGGKGIRLVYNEEDLPDMFLQVQNEVIGSPIFLMQLCKNNRHIEVQIVGDESGHAVAFSGRDCSTQRRFQKIFEEAPPAVVPPKTFREMEKAAQRLTQSIGYIGAGTVEFLYNADEDKYYFLELNPRLQVEHPVTEGITNVNLPATQLQVAMGIPLSNIPEVRRFYGKDMYGTGDIDFIAEDYPPIDSHVIAARITAENPDEGFKPTAGKIERVKFQSAGNVWGYFCIGPNGGIHEFADSQFGHVFAKSPDREAARKSLIVALKDMEVRGEIRTTVEYLVQLLETDEFKSNAVTTSWLDGLLKEKSLKVAQAPHDIVLAAAIFHAFQHVKTETKSVIDSFKKGQVYVGGIPSISSFDLEIPFEDTRYQFQVELIGPELYRFSINGQSINVEITETAEGALLASFDGGMHRIIGTTEPLGLRLSLDGVTTLLPNIVDPTELRTDVTGKIVRYLQPNGGQVKKGEGYIEIEAMKMIMTLKATEDGQISHSLSPGTVIAGGDLLATMELTDPSRVKKIEEFAGQLDLSGPDMAADPKEALTYALAGFKNDPDAAVQNALAGADATTSLDLITSTLDEFVRVEAFFDGKVPDEVVRDLIKANAEDLEVTIAAIRAHQQLDMRRKLVLAMLRQTESLRDRFDLDHLPEGLLESLRQLRKLESKDYGDLKIAADTIIQSNDVKPFDSRVSELRSQLLGKAADLNELAGEPSISAGVDMLTYLFTDSDAEARSAALEVYIRRIYRAYRLLEVKVDNEGRRASWTYQYMDGPSATSIVRHGVLNVVSSLKDLQNEMPRILNDFGSTLPEGSEAVHEVYLVCSSRDKNVDVEALEANISAEEPTLSKLGIRKVNVLVPVARQNPLYFSFPQYKQYKEDVARRDMRPTFHHLLELTRLNENFALEQLHAVGKEVHVFLGTEKTEKPVRGGPPQVVFVRGVSNTPGITSFRGAERALVMGLDELERAQANSKVNLKSSSKIFLHALPLLEDAEPLKLAQDFKEIIAALKSKYATRLLKLRVDQIETLARLSVADEQGDKMVQPIRFVASSMEGEWLKATTFLDYPDPVIGVTSESCVLGEGQDDVCLLDAYETSSMVQSKRSIARNVGSTYAYDFLSLLEIGLVGQWDRYIKSLASSPVEIPSGIFESNELLEGPNGELNLGSRPIGTNRVGMLAWHVTMKTPEYPEGRDVVVIANDVTVKSGSFSVAEDEVYYKASEYARKLKIPRVYIACNAGARIGLYDDLKSKMRLKFVDDQNPSKGFEYLYLDNEDYESLPAGAVNARKVPEGWALDDIIGTEHGIGVENLQGSGKIAGETSQAYDDVFTLSYVTGRSVGIGAYLVRLGQRIIQKSAGPIILTGFSALNRLLGREVYTSQDQLGGPQIMVPNGVTHLEVENDQEGVDAILDWLSYVPKKVGDLPASRKNADPVTRPVKWRPTKAPYDPRLLFTGTRSQPGFFDKGSFKEYLAGWAKSVVVGRGRLGGIPMGAIAVETRQVEQIIPADPANPESSESVLPQAGKVWYPDSAFKTAQAIRDFDKEGLPVMIFANWRGFSGGSRDMAMEVLKFGSMIVDALREFSNPVYIYIPPHGELRGGSWVVLDPTINLDQMEMYADPDSRGGVLEPSGIIEIKFRDADQLKVMHRNDPQLEMLDAELEATAEGDEDSKAAIKEQIKSREQLLKPVYVQAATEFADLHDKTGRMKAKEVIRDAVPWDSSREYFYYRAKRRMLEDSFVKRLQEASKGSLSRKVAMEVLSSLYTCDCTDNASVIEFLSNDASLVDAKIKNIRDETLEAQLASIKAEIAQG